MFEVGKQVWFVNTANPGIKLFLVTEEIVKKSLDGETREYVFQGTYQDKSKKFLSQNLTGAFFIDSNSAFKFMHDQAATAIKKMLQKAEAQYSNVLGPSLATEIIEEPSPPVILEDPITGAIAEDIIVELPDGTKARMKGGING
mgnify:FL=1